MTATPVRAAVTLFGGTFDPFHNGHLRMAVEVREALGLHSVILLPSHHPPHKPRQPISAARHRLAMVRAGAAGVPGLEVSDAEIAREGPSFSLVTVREFGAAFPGADIHFVIGADAFSEILTWHRPEELLAACDFILLPRAGAAGAVAAPPGLRIEKEEPRCYSWKGDCYRLPGGRRLLCPSIPALDISARSIREKVRAGECIRGLVPPEVERYIAENGLYVIPGEDRKS